MSSFSELRGIPLPNPEASLNDVLAHNIRTHPDVLALVSTQQPSSLYGISDSPATDAASESGCLRWTYQDLDVAINRFVAGLRDQGLDRGDPLICFMPNTAEYVIATWAAYRIGCAYVPINPRTLSNAGEIRHILHLVRKECPSDNIGVIAGSSDSCARIEEFTSDLECKRILVEGERDGWIPFKNLVMRSANGVKSLCREHHEQVSDKTLFFTSGTTSLPKGCVMPSAYGFSAALRWRQSHASMLPGDRVLFTLPNNHGFGWVCIMSAFLNAATVVLPGPKFVPETVVKTIWEEQVSHAGLVPTMLYALSNVPLESRKLSCLKRIVMGGSTPTEEVIKICLETLGATGVENLYGMTEGLLVSSDVVQSAEELIHGRDVAVGTPLPGMVVRLFAKDSTAPVQIGEAGELHFSGPSLIDGYVGGEESGSSSKNLNSDFYKDEDGRPWFRSGDKVFLGNDNRLYLIGRYKDTIIRGGENIEPSAIEAVLGALPDIKHLQPQVVRAPDRIAGEIPVVVVNQQVNAETVESVKEAILTSMGDLYVPADVISIQQLGHDEYPKTAAGKVQKSKIEVLIKEYCEKQNAQEDLRVNGSVSGPQVSQALCMAIEKEKGIQVDLSSRMIEMGVDSIRSIAILKRVQNSTGVSLPSSVFFTQATLGAICQQISSTDLADFVNFTPIMEDAPSDRCFSVLLQGTPKAGVPSLFLTPPGSGNAYVYRTIPKFADDRAVYSFGSPFLMTKLESSWTIEETATIYANTIEGLDPEGPYILCGWSMGTATAYETAYQLHERGKRVLGIIMLDLALPRPLETIPEASVELFQMMGVFPPIRRAGKPDVEIPMFRKKHRVAAYYAKMKYKPRAFDTLSKEGRPRIFVIWAGHGDHDRMAASVREATELLEKEGPGKQLAISTDWLSDPRESFDAGGWDEMVGPENVEWGVVEDADHDTLIESEELVVFTKDLMEKAIQRWVQEAKPKCIHCG
ncbi:hypothetical protein PDE_08155 [Penicillium oxalicum 114-2]|uniref:Carrier domain-containing protein n=1 Tax=Penicillium oxalicum (strain 114-2 / CGMCC 5302) TaxID=933388 RepID=S8B2Y0_PENO1|nr:hypothetical protein PDE_08155 [Penicillium oxalicum 114-2]